MIKKLVTHKSDIIRFEPKIQNLCIPTFNQNLKKHLLKGNENYAAIHVKACVN